MPESREEHLQEAIDSAGPYYPHYLFHNFPIASEHTSAQLHLWSYLDIRDLAQILGEICPIILVPHGVGDLLQAGPRVSAMYCEPAWMRSQHLLLKLQIEELLGPSKSLGQSLRGEMMIGDIDKADILACFDELLRDCSPLL